MIIESIQILVNQQGVFIGTHLLVVFASKVVFHAELYILRLCKMTGGLMHTVRSLPYELSDGLSPAIAAVLPFSDHRGAF